MQSSSQQWENVKYFVSISFWLCFPPSSPMMPKVSKLLQFHRLFRRVSYDLQYLTWMNQNGFVKFFRLKQFLNTCLIDFLQKSRRVPKMLMLENLNFAEVFSEAFSYKQYHIKCCTFELSNFNEFSQLMVFSFFSPSCLKVVKTPETLQFLLNVKMLLIQKIIFNDLRFSLINLQVVKRFDVFSRWNRFIRRVSQFHNCLKFCSFW